MRLRPRLVLAFALAALAASGLTAALAAASVASTFRRFVQAADEGRAGAWAEAFAARYAKHGGWEGVQEEFFGRPGREAPGGGDVGPASGSAVPPAAPASAPGYPRPAGGPAGDRVVLADSGGLIVADDLGLLVGTLHPEHHLVHGLPVVSEGRRVGTVMVGTLVDSALGGLEEDFLAAVVAASAGSAAVALALSAVLGLAMAGAVAAPVARLETVVRRLAAGDYEARVGAPADGGPARGCGGGRAAAAERGAPEGDDEIASLGASFDAMAAELGRLEEARRRLIADAAHELRTPVALVRAALEAMLDGVLPADEEGLRSAHEETLRLSRLIDALRELEVIDAGKLRLELEPLDLGAAARETARLFAPAALAAGVSIEAPAESDPPVAADADPLRLGEILRNLVDNALRHVPRGGRIRVTVESEAESRLEAGGGPGRDVSLLAVEDSGPGIPEEERGRVLERFYRLDRSRSSASGGRGLGLAIASEIARAHGGSLRAAEPRELGGARFELRLPLRRATS